MRMAGIIVLNLLRMNIIGENFGNYEILMERRDEKLKSHIFFNPETKELYINEEDSLGRFMKKNEYQLRKLLHNKRPETYKIGFKLDFSIIDKKDVARFNDKNNIIVTEDGKVKVVEKSSKKLIEIYTDGSFDEIGNMGAYGYAISKEGIVVEEYYSKSLSKSSSHLELLAVIDFLEKSEYARCRIYTDSQYVRKGITEWIFHWRENGFMTANGTKAKNAADWIRLDTLIRDKYIEWLWIKSHRDNEIHNMVDAKARQKAKEKD